MLLAFVSVLGVFFGYFVRKSLREVEEDLRGHVTQNMDFWEKEKNRLSSEVTAKLTEIEKQQSEFKQMIARGEPLLKALEAAAKAESQKLTDQTARTATAVAAIDADNSIPGPGEGAQQ